MTNKEKFIDLLSKVERNGIDDLINYLETTDFYTAPASTRFHGSHKEGLLIHSLNVYECLKGLYGGPLESIIIIALLHDLCKANFYSESTRNKKIDGVWKQVPFYLVDEALPLGHGEKSLFLIQRFIKLTDEEAVAIRYHMGAFDKGAGFDVSTAFEKYPLALYTHMADLQATYIIESRGEN